ncbi:hypothetical protein [Hymenobacter koreensis]|uniref:LamG domain-containing protein n=1 Tax=Hymenobacter koreensis TaxID=1084523 RepID=A0ABP8JKR4_9BACT
MGLRQYYLGLAAQPAPVGPPVLTPLPTAGLFARWKAGEGMTLSGNQVAGWTDSVSGLVAYQPTAAWRPVYDAAGLNGQPGLLFNGSLLQVDGLNLSDTQQLTVALVLRLDNNGTHILLEHSPNYNGVQSAWLLYRDLEGSTPATQAAVLLAGGYGRVLNPGPASAPHVTVWTVDTATAPMYRLDLNESSVLPPVEYGATNVPFVNQPLFIGARAGLVAPMSGVISEILVYKQAYTDRTQLKQSLYDTYAI